MVDITTLSLLRDRLAAASKMTPEIWAHVVCALLAPAGSTVEQSRFNGAWCIYVPTPNGGTRLWEDRSGIKSRLAYLAEARAWTEAALILVERLYPSLVLKMSKIADGGSIQVTSCWDANDDEAVYWDGSNLLADGGISITRALVSSLIARSKIRDGAS